jgi:hypothetical protein
MRYRERDSIRYCIAEIPLLKKICAGFLMPVHGGFFITHTGCKADSL